MELIQPSVDYKYSYLAAEGEFQAEGQHKGFDIEAAEKDFNTVVQRMHSWATGKDLPNNYNVPFTSYWLVDKGVYIGTVNIRHFLSERLQTIGGHIGYSIRPSMRKKGYGTAILRLALLKAKELDLSRALVTCDETNIASRKIIEKNGGVLENKVPNPEGGPDKLRFWIDLSRVP